MGSDYRLGFQHHDDRVTFTRINCSTKLGTYGSRCMVVAKGTDTGYGRVEMVGRYQRQHSMAAEVALRYQYMFSRILAR